MSNDMMEQVIVKTVDRFLDHRGFVFEPLEGEVLAWQKNVHVVVSRPGAIRGNHYHQVGTESLAVCGPARVRIREGEAVEEFSIPADTIYRLTIPPMVGHAIQNTGESDSLLIAFNTEAHDPHGPDWIRDVLIPVE